MSIIKAINNAIVRCVEKKWDYIYFLVDVHGTVFKPSYLKEEKFEFYPYAKEVLFQFSKTPGVKLILWTSSTKEYIDKYLNILTILLVVIYILAFYLIPKLFGAK